MPGTFKAKQRLSKEKQTNLFINLAKTISSLNNPTEVAHFLKDLLSEPEVLMLAKRLQIAEFLMAGMTYGQIREDLKVAFNTIAKVQTWLETYGQGYRTAIGRITKKQNLTPMSGPFYKLKRKYPMYFWPQLLLEELVRSANKREKDRLIKIVGQLKEKTKLSKELLRLLS